MRDIKLIGLSGLPLIGKGDDLGKLIVESITKQGINLQPDDILAIAQKVVSKAEGHVVDLATIEPSAEANKIAEQTGRDARLCQVYLNESKAVLRIKGRMVITRHRLGFECSSAGVDRSNVAPHAQGIVVLLPENPDQSARAIRQAVNDQLGITVAVVITDSLGRHDREGSIGLAIGVAGINPIEVRHQYDLYGNEANTAIAIIDEVSAAASLIMGQADESIPVVLVRGVRYTRDDEASIFQLLITEE
ncbi:coenzyme F420-0:L-glutamate ligase [Patescibacteria group bacterium]|nr:coenzyme F420-0:L-glutamate ligase [Patescibacteria group bacterium]